VRVRRAHRPRVPRRPASERLRRGIYLLPSLFTVGNMLCGFAALLHAIHGRLELSGWLILLAGVLDGLDGRIARLTRATSDFGKEYDSLADVVSFGVAPAVLAYQWGLRGIGRWGWAVAFLFLVAGSVRLARFNVHAGEGDRRFFIGLPIPAGAGALTVMVLLSPEQVSPRWQAFAVWPFVLIVALLMVSTVRYRSFKNLNLRQRLPATAFFLFALIVAVIAVSPLPTMAFLAGVYLLSGPLEMVLDSTHHKRRAPTALPMEEMRASASAAHAEHP
jgi:CDP-diacylglycerol--serine O-phosphatidyltransferase